MLSTDLNNFSDYLGLIVCGIISWSLSLPAFQMSELHLGVKRSVTQNVLFQLEKRSRQQRKSLQTLSSSRKQRMEIRKAANLRSSSISKKREIKDWQDGYNLKVPRRNHPGVLSDNPFMNSRRLHNILSFAIVTIITSLPAFCIPMREKKFKLFSIVLLQMFQGNQRRLYQWFFL